MRFLSTLLAMYIVTGMLLFGMAFLLYQFQLGELFVTVGVMVTYVGACFLGGLILSFRLGESCGFWGLLMGSTYFCILFVGSMIVNKGLPQEWLRIFAIWLMCGCAGMLGGMFYPRKRLSK